MVRFNFKFSLLQVNGLFNWCPFCCHGGHSDHLENWFKSNEYCPSGCGHKCRWKNTKLIQEYLIII